ncbi:hypothetical protein KCU87_g221, partial [Aureobasidium melanogenum]
MRLVCESVQKVIQKNIAVVNSVGVLSNNPDHGSLRFRVFAEDVTNHHRRLLNDVRDLCCNEFQQCVNAKSCRRFNLDGQLSNSANRFSDKVDVNFGCVLSQFVQNLFDVVLSCEHEDEFQFDIGQRSQSARDDVIRSEFSTKALS